MMRTIFTQSRMEHRTIFGVWRAVEYSKILLLDDRGQSITIIGEDVVGKSIKIVLLKWDGNLEEALRFLRQKTSR